MAKKFLQVIGLVSAFCCAISAANAASKVVEKIAAVVNNDVVLESSVNAMMKSIKSSTPAANLPDDDTLHNQVLERLIVDNLILQQAAQNKITVSDAELNKAIAQIAASNRLSVDELRAQVAKTGLSYVKYQQKIRDEILIDKTRMAIVGRRVNIMPQEVDTLAETIAKKPQNNSSVKLSHILIAVPENATKTQLNNAKKRADSLAQQLKNGANFAKLATAYSNDSYALKGGNMGWQRVNELPSLFESKVRQAGKGQIIGPLRSGVGYHILKVVDNRTVAPTKIKVKEVHARHILVKTSVLLNDEQAKAKLQKIREQIMAKQASFEDLARASSEDPGSADKGGDLGWAMPDSFDPLFREALLRLKKGEISQPIKSSFGWHLIQLLDTRMQDRTELANKDKAYRMIFNRKFAEELQVWYQELRADAYVNIMNNSTK